jgi:hypothetical protein
MKKRNHGVELSVPIKSQNELGDVDNSTEDDLDQEEISDLFSRQKSNEAEYQRLKAAINKTRVCMWISFLNYLTDF